MILELHFLYFRRFVRRRINQGVIEVWLRCGQINKGAYQRRGCEVPVCFKDGPAHDGNGNNDNNHEKGSQTCLGLSAFSRGGLKFKEDLLLEANLHWRQIGIGPELSKQIAIEMCSNSFTQFGTNSKLSLAWIDL